MKNTLLPKASHEGILKISDKELNCAVLATGQRILTLSAIFRALGRPVRGNSRLINTPTFMDAKSIQPFVNEEVRGLIKKVPFVGLNGAISEGYDATLLPLVAEVYLKARDAGALTYKQKDTAHQAEVLIRSLARVGIIALVDEATGYQYDREEFELQKILKSYISEELLPWQKKFPDVFYRELFRLNGWDYSVNGFKKRPGVIGRWTNMLVYDQLPKGVLAELKKNTPKSKAGNTIARLHQSLSEDIGNSHLSAQINQVVTLFQLSNNMKHMWSQFESLKNRRMGQFELPFDFNSKGYTVYKNEDLQHSDRVGIVELSRNEMVRLKAGFSNKSITRKK